MPNELGSIHTAGERGRGRQKVISAHTKAHDKTPKLLQRLVLSLGWSQVFFYRVTECSRQLSKLLVEGTPDRNIQFCWQQWKKYMAKVFNSNPCHSNQLFETHFGIYPNVSNSGSTRINKYTAVTQYMTRAEEILLQGIYTTGPSPECGASGYVCEQSVQSSIHPNITKCALFGKGGWMV